MKPIIVAMIALCLIGSSAVLSSTIPVDNSIEAIKNRWVTDQKFINENYIYAKVHTTDSDYNHGKFNKQVIETQELMVVNGRLMSREVRDGNLPAGKAGKYKFQVQEDGSFDMSSESLAKFMDIFSFVDKQSMEYPPEPPYDEVTLMAKPGEVKGDFEKVASKLNINLQIWTGGPVAGTIKSLTGSIFLKKGEEVKVKRLFGLAGADVVSFNMKLTTQAIEGKVVPKTIEFDYDIRGTGIAKLVKRKQHEIIEFKDYRKATVEQKLAYLKQ